MLVAAAMTAYVLIGLVPLLAVGVRVATAVVGSDAVTSTGAALARYLEGPLPLDEGIRAVTAGADEMSWWTALLALLPVSLYAEGTVRALERFSRERERTSRTLRGRLLTVPAVVVAVLAVVVVVTLLWPLLEGSFGVGTGGRLLGVFVAFLVLWWGFAALMAFVYRLGATTPIRLPALLGGAAASGSWLAGQSLGYVLVLRWIGDVGRPYGGSVVAGTVAAVVFLLYLDHVVVLLGYLLALHLHEQGARPWVSAAGG